MFTDVEKIPENKPPGSLVGRVIAHDNDAGPNGQIDFTLSWKSLRHQRLFSINERGEITTNEVLDREENPNGIRFTVIAEDKGQPVYRASAEVSVQIEDENDCVPKFGSHQYHFSIDEDVEPYRRETRRVGTVQASDCDTGPNADLRYYFEEPNSPFEVVYWSCRPCTAPFHVCPIKVVGRI
ncbi:unnamed protein product [Mesocestoides corti]|uniref:Cadherin domain-containing protein n=1 Tax=Mesocestoides corti TaxID=53468 RepID=A0A0R3UR60_MESCO|nr:unnamed protein product [Mesocestoides corti]